MTKSKIPPHAIEDIKRSLIHGVGYRSPPTQHQFKKGQSGNPKGRPRKIHAADTGNTLNLTQTKRMQDVLRERVTVNAASGPRKITLGEALQQKHKQLALVDGRTMPLLQLKKELRELEREEQQAIAEDQDGWRDYIKNFRIIEAAAKAKSEPLKGFWILPENIVFYDDAKCRIRGAVTEESLPHFELLEKLLKLLIFEITYDNCCNKQADDFMPAQLKLVALLQYSLTTAAARASNEYWDMLEEHHICSFWKSAQAERAKVWADIGLPMPRKRWLTPMTAKDRKIAERHRDPIRAKLLELKFGKRRKVSKRAMKVSE